MKFAVAAVVAAFTITTAASATEIVVTSPAGMFTNAGPTNATGPGAGYDTWFANNVRNGGSVGITSVYQDGGNGAVQFSGPANAKADLEYYFSTPNQFLLSDLTALSFDFLRSSTSTAASHLHPSMRLYVDDGAGKAGYLVYEGIYNGATPFASDVFVSIDVLPAKIWSTNTLPNPAANYTRTAADWAALVPNLKVTGLSFGIGSGWAGTFDGAVDKVTFGVNGVNTTFNFEAAEVPEPAMLGLFGLGAMGLGLARRRRRA